MFWQQPALHSLSITTKTHPTRIATSREPISRLNALAISFYQKLHFPRSHVRVLNSFQPNCDKFSISISGKRNEAWTIRQNLYCILTTWHWPWNKLQQNSWKFVSNCRLAVCVKWFQLVQTWTRCLIEKENLRASKSWNFGALLHDDHKNVSWLWTQTVFEYCCLCSRTHLWGKL